MKRQILLATDLSARCDRAFDRAVSLTREWDAHLTIATALEDRPDDAVYDSRPGWRRTDSELADAESQVRDDLQGMDVDADVIVRRGPAAEFIVDVARAAPQDLIVAGIARSTGLFRVILGATVEALIRERLAPILVVKRRARKPYRNALVGIDFSAESGAALQATSSMFPGATLTVLHAQAETVAASRFAPEPESDAAAHRRLYEKCARFVAHALPAAPGGVRCVVESGFPETLLNQYAVDKQIDLMAAGTRSRKPLLDLLFGNTCEALLLSSPCDLLLVSESQTGDVVEEAE